MNFKRVYGDTEKNSIHVQHEMEVSTSRREYGINPIKDLKPVLEFPLNEGRLLYKIKEKYGKILLVYLLKDGALVGKRAYGGVNGLFTSIII
ncbi:hypothetical protein ACSYR0_03285 (plasmid) [Bacillus cereus]|uniref:hypothetical protein n=1 Tax=Bacillus cereus TaxID=1396 RepID=UPI0001A0E20A|nr:hypothetical protein [Bacillus cereus]EEL61323.1 hypothetical protein bcere0025_59870 [Bacillus cereus F65185]PFI70049.1 hypothetical protein COI85_26725 [Bacillus cereus]PFJ63125.1 hypothetical protein COI94_24920 [Bacillus cereus]PFN42476.1 hypothetical protein COJ57_01575 [Bacillus cereus]